MKERNIIRSISDDRSYDPERGGHRGGSRVHRLRQRVGRRDRRVDPGLQSALGLRFRRLPPSGLPRLDSSVPRELRHGSAFCQDSNETDATRHRLQDENEDNFWSTIRRGRAACCRRPDEIPLLPDPREDGGGQKAISRAAISEIVVCTMRDRQGKPVHRRYVDADLVDENAGAYFRWGRFEEREQRVWQLLDCLRIEEKIASRRCQRYSSLRATSNSDKNFSELIILKKKKNKCTFNSRRRKRVFFSDRR